MIRESIEQFRANRQQRQKMGAVSALQTKQRLGLAQREASNVKSDIRATRRNVERDLEQAAYNPGEKIAGWYEEINSIREERGYKADQEHSTTGAMDIDPMARVTPQARWDGPVGMSGGAGGRAAAEEYLGREMDDKEWEMLTRTTYAEATGDPEEQAAVMSVILNRAKADNYPDSIVDVVMQPNQFQAVTGTRNNPMPSSRFNAFNDEVLQQFEETVTPRLNNFANQNWLNFTAGNPAAYGEGTNINFLDDVNNSEGSAVIGGTIFGTVRGG